MRKSGTLPEGFDRADSFISTRKKEGENISIFKAISALSKIYDMNQAKEIAELLLNSHTPSQFDYSKKYRIKKQESTEESKKDDKLADNDSGSNTVCPRCKEGTLVIRVVKSKEAREKYNNDRFLGCSRYPKCRYARGIVENPI